MSEAPGSQDGGSKAEAGASGEGRRGWWGGRWLRRPWFVTYLVLLALSHGFIAMRSPVVAARRSIPPVGATRLDLMLPRMTAEGPAGGVGEARSYRLTVWRWGRLGKNEKPPVVLLHGSPSGGGREFASYAQRLTAGGYVVYAPDLPGFGASDPKAPNYSMSGYARLMLVALDDLKIERAHVVGWSLGGGSGILMSSLAPDRIASLTMLASVGAQETEGSGDYYFEHAKYRIGQALLVALPEVLPHFGLLGPREVRRAFLRNFIDSDMRPMRGIMRRLAVPTLILHGRDDYLVPAWAAEEHHEDIPGSTLVMLEGNHFLPLAGAMARSGQFDQVVEHTLAHLEMHDRPGVPGVFGEARFARSATAPPRRIGGIQISRTTPWWGVVLAIFLSTMVSEDLTIITVGLLLVSQSLDWGVGLIGCFFAVVLGDLGLWGLGRFMGRRVLTWPVIRNIVNERSLERWGRAFDNHTGKAVLLSRCLPGTRMPTFIAAGILSRKARHFAMWVAIAAFIWTPLLLGATMLVGPRLLEVFRTVFHGPWAIVAAIVVMYLVIRLIGYETIPMGRDRLKADLRRLVSREFWPAWVFYLPPAPWALWLALRHRSLMVFSCANPGIPNGGGIIGESKTRILLGFGAENPLVLPATLIPEGEAPEQRADKAIARVRGVSGGEAEDRGGYPVVLKPDAGERGAGMKVARDDEDVRAYFHATDRAVQVQRYHPGPYEIGLLWARVPAAGRPVDEWPGEVFSATGKVFPVIEGDGKRTLEALIWRHPRFRMQARVFLKRFADQTDRVLPTGERLQLALAGNHCQGTMFTDAMDRVTAALARRIDELAQAWRDPETGARIDFGRFDIRYASEADLRDATGIAAVEFNGTASESTSMYDPGRSFVWSYGLLGRHWSRLFRIGAARRAEGVRAMTIRALLAAGRRHRRGGAPSRLSD